MPRPGATQITSTMQDDFPLTITAILTHGSRVFGRSECVTWQGDSARHTSYHDIEPQRAAAWPSALTRLGDWLPGTRSATFCWNNQEHLEAYYAIPCMGAVVHTLNIRLPAQQLAHIVNDAADQIIIVDGSLLPLLAPVVPSLTSVEAFIVIGDGDTSVLGGPAGLLATTNCSPPRTARTPGPSWTNARRPRCVTPAARPATRGAWSTRTARRSCTPWPRSTSACTGASEADRQLTIVPMFHVNAWGIPFAAFLSGTTMHMPGKYMTPAGAGRLHRGRALRPWPRASPPSGPGSCRSGAQREIDLSSLRMGTSGGAAMPRSLMETFEQAVRPDRIIQGWGMTETSPVGGLALPPADVEPGTVEEMDYRMKSGRLLAGVQMRIVDDDGHELPLGR